MPQTSELNQTKQKEFMLLYEPVHDRLSRFIQTIVWNNEDARDVLAETVLRTFENFEKIRDKKAFLFYMFSIAGNLVKNKGRRKKFWGLFDEEQSVNIVDESSRSDRSAEVKDLYAAMDKLPAKQKEAITLFEISGFSIEEIKEIQGGSLSGVKSRLVRARTELARLLKDEMKQTVLTYSINNNKNGIAV